MPIKISMFFFFILAALSVLTPAVGFSQNTVYTLADTAKANRLLAEADTFAIKNKCDSALLRITQAHEILAYLRQDTTCPRLANSWRELAWCYYKTKNYDTAILTNQKALNLQLSHSSLLDSSLYVTYIIGGRMIKAKGDTLIALDWFKKALLNAWYNDKDLDTVLSYIMGCTKKFEQKKIETDTKLYGFYTILTNFIDTLSKRTDYERPKTVYLLEYTAIFDTSRLYTNKINYLSKAIEMQNRLSDDIAKDTTLIELYDKLGETLSINSRETESFQCYKKCLNICTNVFGPQHFKNAKFYNQLGVYYSIFSRFDKAILYFDTALSIRNNHFGFISREVAETYTDMSNCYRKMSEFERAIAYAQTALDIYKKAKKDNLDSFYIASASWSLGYAYETNRDYRAAIKHYTYSLKIQSDYPKSLIFSTLGTCYFYLKNYSKAIESLTLSNKMYSQNAAIGNLASENTVNLVVMFFLARAYKIQGSKQDVKRITNEIRDYLVKTSNLDSFFIHFIRGRIAILDGNFSIAVNAFMQGQSLISKDSSAIQSLLFRNLLFHLAVAHKELYKENRAIKHLFSSYETLNTLLVLVNKVIDVRLNYTTPSSNLYVSDNNILEEAITVNFMLHEKYNSSNYLKNTFSYFELSKTFSLNTLLRENSNKGQFGISYSIIEQQKELKLKITIAEKRQQELLIQNDIKNDSLRILNDKMLYELKGEYDNFKKILEKNYPKYHRLKYDKTTFNLSYVQDTLLRGTNKSMLSYFVGDSSIFVYVVRKDTIVLKEIKKDFPLEEWVKQMQNGIYGFYELKRDKRTDQVRDSTYNDYVEAASKLYQKLVAPIDTFLTKNIIIIPDGVLGYIPFDALLDSTPPNGNKLDKVYWRNCSYWGNKKTISYAYSATSLKEMIDKQHQAPPQYKGVLALAPFDDGALIASAEGTTRDIDSEEIDNLSSLDYSGIEVDSIVKIVGGKYYLRRYANRAILDSLGSKYPIVHLSTHAKADDRLGDYAYFALKSTKDTTKFEKIYAKDIYNMTFNADLVTLSACETSKGELKRGEGIISMGRAFAYAGAKSIVPSLWVVNDKRSEELMTAFYTNLMRGMRKDDALSTAKRDFMKNHKNDGFAHPYFWSAFIPIGDMKPIIFKP